MRDASPAMIPHSELADTMQSDTNDPEPAVIPVPVLSWTWQCCTHERSPTMMPPKNVVPVTTQRLTVERPPTTTAYAPFPSQMRSSTIEPVPVGPVEIVTAGILHPTNRPLRTTMLDLATAVTPSSESLAPVRVKPIRSTVTLSAAISIPLLPVWESRFLVR